LVDDLMASPSVAAAALLSDLADAALDGSGVGAGVAATGNGTGGAGGGSEVPCEPDSSIESNLALFLRESADASPSSESSESWCRRSELKL
jgi:hypothetical protein